MKFVAIAVALAAMAAMAAGCQNESKLEGGGGGGDLAARVKKLEETNAKYAEARDTLKVAQAADYYDTVVMATGEKQFRSKGQAKPN